MIQKLKKIIEKRYMHKYNEEMDIVFNLSKGKLLENMDEFEPDPDNS